MNTVNQTEDEDNDNNCNSYKNTDTQMYAHHYAAPYVSDEDR